MQEKTRAFFAKRKEVFIVCMLFLAVLFLCGMLVRADTAKEEGSGYKYYTSVLVRSGDTLWDIASRYCGDSGRIREYMKELKQINHLSGDAIHAGRYLTVVYYSEEYK